MTIDRVLDRLRPNIKSMKAYSSARHEFQGNASIYLDANESPYDTLYNRYPDPRQLRLKRKIAQLSNVKVEQLLLGNGSDEVLDLIVRAFCEPRIDSIITLTPTYGMYQVLADLNDIKVKAIPLKSDFQIDVKPVINAIDQYTKIVFVCSPNNPTGNTLATADIEELLSQNILVVIDEAYIDFAANPSWSNKLEKYSNLIICQTLSKAKGMAGLRIGCCIANVELVNVLNRIKPPYNISKANIDSSIDGLKSEKLIMDQIEEVKSERDALSKFLQSLDFVRRVYPSEANFLLVKVDNARALMDYTGSRGIILRDRSINQGCAECLRISIGTPVENRQLIEILKTYKQ